MRLCSTTARRSGPIASRSRAGRTGLARARYVVQQSIAAKLPTLLERCENVTTCAPVGNGYLPERKTAIAARSVVLQVPKVRDRSGFWREVQFIDCPGAFADDSMSDCHIRSASEAHLDGRHGKQVDISLGEDAKGLSTNSVSGCLAFEEPSTLYEVLDARLERNLEMRNQEPLCPNILLA